MLTYDVMNRRTKTKLGRVAVDDPSEVLSALARETGCSIEDIAMGLGRTVEEAKAALDIVEVDPTAPDRPKLRLVKGGLPPRALYIVKECRGR